MTDKTGWNLSKAQERYKRYLDWKVRFTPTISLNDLVFVDKPPPSEKTQAEQMYRLPRSKLLPKSEGPYPVISFDDHTVTIREDGIPNTISIDGVTLAPRTSPSLENSSIASGTSVEKEDDADEVDKGNGQESEQTDAKGTATEIPAAPDVSSTKAPPIECTVELIVGHVGVDGEHHYVFRWYGNSAVDDTTELPYNIPEHFRSATSRRTALETVATLEATRTTLIGT